MAQEWGTPRAAWDRVATADTPPTSINNPAAAALNGGSERECILPRGAAGSGGGGGGSSSAAGAGKGGAAGAAAAAASATPLSHALSLLGFGLEGGADEPYFTPSERATLRAWEPTALPVFGDLVFDRTRSRLLTVLLFTLVGLASFLQLFLPQLSLGPLQLQRISTCWEAVNVLSKTPGSAFTAADAQLPVMSGALDGTYIAFILTGLLAVTPWNPPFFLPLGAAASTAYLVLYSSVDARYCFRLGAQPALLVSTQVGGVWLNQVSTTILFYNIFVWSCALLSTLELYRLCALMAISASSDGVPIRQFFALQHWPAPSPREAALLPLQQQPQQQQQQKQADSLLARARAGAVAWCRATYTDVLCAVPLRHCIACVLSTVGLATMASTMSGWASLALVQLRALRALLVDPSAPLPADTPQFLRQLIDALNSYIPTIWRSSVFGTLDGALVWVTIGSWLVCLVFCSTCAASMATVARHRRELLARHLAEAGAGPQALPSEGSAGGGSARGEGGLEAGAGAAQPRKPLQQHARHGKLTPPPDDLGVFVIFDATQYVAAHLVCHLFVFLVFFLFLSVIVVAVGLLYLNGLGTNLSWLALVAANLARSQVYDFLLFKLPPFVQRWVLGPLYRLCGWDSSRPASALVRRLLGLFCLASRWLDGPHVLHPRAFALADAIISFSVGPLLGIVDAVTRMVLGSVFGLLKISFLYEAVIPLTIASFDRPYMSYGAMQRVALLEALDSEVAGVPPRQRDKEWR